MKGTSVVPTQILQLWPAPARVALRRASAPGESGYFVVPSIRHPRYLVPVDVAGADRMFARHGGSRADRLARAVWRRGHRSGIAPRLPLARLSVTAEPDGIEAYLAGAVGEPVQIGVLLGPPRANQKPVLQCFSKAGETIAFAKLGMTPLSATLLDAEAQALALLQDRSPATFAAPALLHHGTWRQTPVLVQRALPSAQGGNRVGFAPIDVMAEIAALDGIVHEPMGESGFYAKVAPPAETTWHDIDITAFAQLHDTLDTAGPVAFGCWHGDFGPWNMARRGTTTEVWDWERFSTDVPVGLDAAHYQTQRGVAANTEPAEAWHRITRDVEAVLGQVGLDQRTAPTVGSAYLLEIVSRYRTDVGESPTPALRRRMTWLSAVAGIALAHNQEPVR